MTSVRTPIIGRTYSVLCPICCSNVSFDCRSLAVYGIQCNVCYTLIDLRNPSVPLPPNDPCSLIDFNNNNNNNNNNGSVCFSPEVEEFGGGSATLQLNMVMSSIVEEQKREMPTTMSGETTQALSARRAQALSEKFSFLNPLVYAIEYIIFGNKPIARVGHIRIFRKHLPFFGIVNIPVPKTSVSYAAPLSLVFTLATALTFFAYSVNDYWLWHIYPYIWILIAFFIIFLFMSVYTDPGFVRPAYLSSDNSSTSANNNNNNNNNNNAGSSQKGGVGVELTLKDIEARQRESQWENINGQLIERKWCSTCELYRPPRAAHCYFCGMCVLEHDHHCSVIGVCVGRRNVRTFYLFVLTCCMLAWTTGMSVAVTLWNPSRNNNNNNNNSNVTFTGWQIGIAIFIMIGSLLIVAVPTALLIFALTSSFMTETTTRERLQNAYENKRNPFSRGVFRNVWYHLTHRNAASLFDDEFVRLCNTRGEKREDFNRHSHSDKGDTVVCL